MARVSNAVEILPKSWTAWVGCTSVTDDRQTTDGRATAYSERELTFTFANKTNRMISSSSNNSTLPIYTISIGILWNSRNYTAVCISRGRFYLSQFVHNRVRKYSISVSCSRCTKKCLEVGSTEELPKPSVAGFWGKSQVRNQRSQVV